MKTKWLYKLSFTALYLAMAVMLHAQGTAFTYQGRLNHGASPANGIYDFRFRLASDPLGNNYVGGSILSNALPVSGGLFTVTLDFGAGVLTGSNYWLEVDVRTNGAGGYNTLAPLQALTPSPYAIFANSAGTAGTAGSLSGILPSGQLAGTYSSAVSLNNASNSFTGGFNGNGSNVTNVNAATLGGFGANQFWKTTGNTNTVAGVNFLGTTDNQPLELSVNSQRALRLEPNTNGAPNMIGGATNNFVDAGIIGATIAGGGAANYSDIVSSFFNASNHVSASFGTISGGRANTVDAGYGVIGGGGGNVIQSNATYSAVVGGIWNTIQAGANQSAIGGGYLNTMQSNASYSTIGGGIANTLQTNAFSSTIGGGYGNTIGANAYATTISGGEYNGGSGRDATVGGGFANFCGADRAAVGGGVVNSAYGYAATVPGGYQNEADGQYSFAAGQNARASHDGSFVWSDESSFTTFASTGINEFDIRAYGGVHFVTGGAGVTFDGQTVATTNALTNLNAASITSGTLPDVRLSTNVALRSGGNAFTGQQVVTDGSVGVGTGSPQAPLHVRGGYGSQLVLQDNVLGHSWSINNDANDNLVFVPNTGTGGYIYRGNGNYFSLSDLRLKQDVRPLGGVLERVLQLRPVSYRFRSAPEGTPLTLGFIAQEVEPLFPEVVGERAGMKTLAYSELIPVTVGALQELNRKVDSENAALRAENAELKRRLEVLEEIVCNQK